MKYLYILGTVVFTVYGQVILKWRIGRYVPLPEQTVKKFFFLVKLLVDPFIFSGFASAFVASLFWMAALSKFDLSFAYPFMSSSFVLVFIISVFIFNDSVTVHKVVGLALIVLGILISSRSM